MRYASLTEEKKLWKKGYKNIICLDEAGRGALCGPVVAGAVIIHNSKFKIQNLRDSKQLSAKQREEFYKILTKHPAVRWGIGIVSEKVIDKINILEATKLAMIKAITKIQNAKIKNQNDNSKFKINYLILDGKMTLNLPILQKSIVKADEKVFSCAAASIIAKVTRDRIMLRYDKKYPRYGFCRHKGYGTKLHLKILKKIGPCAIHRKSFDYYGRTKTKAYQK